MKLKKHVSKLLFCSMLFNSVPFYSNATSNSNLNRYETLEGEIITLDNINSNDVSEIEILGNTYQDTQDSKNLIYTSSDKWIQGYWNQWSYNLVEDTNTITLIDYIDVSSYSQCVISVNNAWKYGISFYNANKSRIYIDDSYGQYTNQNKLINFETLSSDRICYIRVNLQKSNVATITPNDISSAQLQLEKGNVATEYEDYYKADLSDIQSVGELYTNKEGEPILDQLGRQQYKIEIEGCNDNLVNNDDFIIGKYINQNNGEILDNISNKYIEYTKIPNTGRIYIKSDIQNFSRLAFYDSDKKCIAVYMENLFEYNKEIPVNAMYMRFSIQAIDAKISISTSYLKEYISHESNKTTILLPCQLQKVGDVADRLYWDSKKGKYVVEKNIGKDLLKKATSGTIETDTYYQNTQFGAFNDSILKTGSSLSYNKFISLTYFPYYHYYNIYGPDFGSGVNIWGTHITWRIFKTDIESLEEFNNLIKSDWEILGVLKTPQLIETNITKKIKLITYQEKTYISTVSENGINPTLKIYIDRIEQVSQEAVDLATSTSTSSNLTLARMYVNMLPESLYKDQLQAKLNEIFSEDMVLDKLSTTANLDIYIKSENILMMSLDTNTVTFEDYSGVEELELQNAINININSSLPYQLNAYIVGDIVNKEKDKTLDLDVLNIKDSSEVEYKQFDSINSKLVLLDNVEKGNNISHNIDLKLSGNKAHDADVYKTTIKFEAEQK